MRVRPVRAVGLAGRMPITLESATQGVLGEVVDAVAAWQREGMPAQVHPGDLGWNCSFGPETLAGDLRLWRREGQLLAVGMVDQDDGLVRMALAPRVDADEAFARQLVADLSEPGLVLPDHGGAVEARFGSAFRDLQDRVAVGRASFAGSSFSVERWRDGSGPGLPAGSLPGGVRRGRHRGRGHHRVVGRSR